VQRPKRPARLRQRAPVPEPGRQAAQQGARQGQPQRRGAGRGAGGLRVPAGDGRRGEVGQEDDLSDRWVEEREPRGCTSHASLSHLCLAQNTRESQKMRNEWKNNDE